ncbi:Alpha/Beta hydrolase protein [Exophiala viscosa]|uniref:Alpha/Beta hydrolase protein n=1 Tax=Exophiala viscosa TaxID=2486360 RepID=UPI002190FCAE|nr:Alpha/Beta hydrolase protein [Exophiala viscosa]
MPHLDVPGASLYYETVGNGPLLLCISGANGSADIWRMLAGQLKSQFAVALWDRRGFSRSYLIGAQDYDQRIETDADDARCLIDHLSKDGTATVLGNSSGAIVSLELLCRHPDVIKTLIPHEPPAMKFLPDCDELWRVQKNIYDTYRKSGVAPALMKFADMIKAGAEREGLVSRMDARAGPFVAANVMYWFEREVMVYPFRRFDVKELEQHKDKLLLANGRDSNKEALQFRANVVLGHELDLKVNLFAGMHVGFASHPEEFARDLVQALRAKNDFYATPGK